MVKESKGRYTEEQLPLSMNLDLMTEKEIVDTLETADIGLFTDTGEYENELVSETTIEKLGRLSLIMADFIKDRNTKSCLTVCGAGTSGRIAYICSVDYNEILVACGFCPLFRYIIAGGDGALIRAVEGAEDDPQPSTEVVASQVAQSKDGKYGFIGITCGMSAPCVAGPINFLLDTKEDSKNVSLVSLMGFNPIESSRDVPISGVDYTFRDVARRFKRCSQDDQDVILLNPIVGPEVVTGSTRMKSGTATKVILDITFGVALQFVTSESQNDIDVFQLIRQRFSLYKEMVRHTYRNGSAAMQNYMKMFANSLLKGEGVNYIGYDSLGVMGAIDASECPPTFGTEFDVILGHFFPDLRKKWRSLPKSYWPPENGDRAGDNDVLNISLLHTFDEGNGSSEYPLKQENGISPNVLILTHADSNDGRRPKSIESDNNAKRYGSECYIGVLSFNDNSMSGQHALVERFLRLTLLELSAKLIFNAISTGAHVLVGKIYQNRMIDLRVTNNKLYERAKKTISQIMNVSESVAEDNLLRAIYGDKSVLSEIRRETSNDIKEHVEHAVEIEKVVPIALILSAIGGTVSESRKLLSSEPKVRKIVARLKAEMK